VAFGPELSVIAENREGKMNWKSVWRSWCGGLIAVVVAALFRMFLSARNDVGVDYSGAMNALLIIWLSCSIYFSYSLIFTVILGFLLRRFGGGRISKVRDRLLWISLFLWNVAIFSKVDGDLEYGGLLALSTAALVVLGAALLMRGRSFFEIRPVGLLG
jgi:hypothetical protein